MDTDQKLPRPRRKIANLLLAPATQLEIISVILASNLFFCGALVLLFHPVIGYFNLVDQVDHSNMVFFLTIGVIGSVYNIATSLMLLVYTHRLLGPMVAFRRHVQALRSGDYSARTQLRPRDKLADFALELNGLSEDLEKLASPRAAKKKAAKG